MYDINGIITMNAVSKKPVIVNLILLTLSKGINWKSVFTKDAAILLLDDNKNKFAFLDCLNFRNELINECLSIGLYQNIISNSKSIYLHVSSNA
jgi:hypothetical protein